MTEAVVLLVDDEVAFVDTMIRRLDKRGFSVIPAYSGEEALQKLGGSGGSSVEVVVLDVKMPGMGGEEALIEIRKKHPLVEVIMLTGHATVDSAIEGMKRGAFDYLMKPSDMDVLVAKIKSAADKKRAHEEKISQAKAEMIAMRRGD
ncbi:MAG: response regulator [Pseudomonadota bacterium]